MIIDGIFGTGLSRNIDGIAGKAVEMMNGSGKPILSVDILPVLTALTALSWAFV